VSLVDLLAISAACFGLGAVLMAFASRRMEPAHRRAQWLKFGVYILIVHAVVGCAVLGRNWLLGLGLLILAGGSLELRRALQAIAARGSASVPGIVLAWLALAAGLVAFVARARPEEFAFLYIVIAGFDGFSQATGQWLGRHPIAPRLSPGKTVEGFLGGFASALMLAWIVAPVAGLGALAAIAWALPIAVSALAGDLAASWVKRRAGIKDYGRLIPGHGGLLDRFDSLIVAGALLAPVALALGGN
jgi:phosphatidate cytidylyltransferase